MADGDIIKMGTLRVYTDENDMGAEIAQSNTWNAYKIDNDKWNDSPSQFTFTDTDRESSKWSWVECTIDDKKHYITTSAVLQKVTYDIITNRLKDITLDGVMYQMKLLTYDQWDNLNREILNKIDFGCVDYHSNDVLNKVDEHKAISALCSSMNFDENGKACREWFHACNCTYERNFKKIYNDSNYTIDYQGFYAVITPYARIIQPDNPDPGPVPPDFPYFPPVYHKPEIIKMGTLQIIHEVNGKECKKHQKPFMTNHLAHPDFCYGWHRSKHIDFTFVDTDDESLKWSWAKVKVRGKDLLIGLNFISAHLVYEHITDKLRTVVLNGTKYKLTLLSGGDWGSIPWEVMDLIDFNCHPKEDKYHTGFCPYYVMTNETINDRRLWLNYNRKPNKVCSRWSQVWIDCKGNWHYTPHGKPFIWNLPAWERGGYIPVLEPMHDVGSIVKMGTLYATQNVGCGNFVEKYFSPRINGINEPLFYDYHYNKNGTFFDSTYNRYMYYQFVDYPSDNIPRYCGAKLTPWEWVKTTLNGKNIYISTTIASSNITLDPIDVTLGNKQYKMRLLSEKEWKSIDESVLEKIDFGFRSCRDYTPKFIPVSDNNDSTEQYLKYITFNKYSNSYNYSRGFHTSQILVGYYDCTTGYLPVLEEVNTKPMIIGLTPEDAEYNKPPKNINISNVLEIGQMVVNKREYKLNNYRKRWEFTNFQEIAIMPPNDHNDTIESFNHEQENAQLITDIIVKDKINDPAYNHKWISAKLDGKLLYVSKSFPFNYVVMNDFETLMNKIISYDGKRYVLRMITYKEMQDLSDQLDILNQLDIKFDMDRQSTIMMTSTPVSGKSDYVYCMSFYDLDQDGIIDYSIKDYKCHKNAKRACRSAANMCPLLVLDPDVARYEEEMEKDFVVDLGVRNKAFDIDYIVIDSDKNQTITTTEKLNGQVINTRIDNSESSFFMQYTMNITDEYMSKIQKGVDNYITLSSNDGQSIVYHKYKFKKTNFGPKINYNGYNDLGHIDEIPTIVYSVSDEDNDIVTVTEKINGAQIRSFEAVLGKNYIVNLNSEFWNNCNIEQNTITIEAVDSDGAKDIKTITFGKNDDGTLYTVFYHVDGDSRYERIFRSIEGVEELRPYTSYYNTYNPYIDYSLLDIPERTIIKAWMVAHNKYASSEYKSSNVLTFQKASYGKPIVGYPEVNSPLSQDHSEYGYITISYSHEDVKQESDGTLVSLDIYRTLESYKGKIDIHCYVDGKYVGVYDLDDKYIQVGETKKLTVNFDEISPSSRSCKIQYYIVITDTYSGISSSDIEPGYINETMMLNGYHYYNDEPRDPEITYERQTGNEEEIDVQYQFEYIEYSWNPTKDPDNDNCVYYFYLKTPESFNERVLTTSVTSRTGPNIIEYTRKYKITEIRNENDEVVGSQVAYYNNGSYINIQTNDFLGIKIDYLKDHLGKTWNENEKYQIRLEAHDDRSWPNSYYGLSSLMEYHRRRHVPPNDLEVTIIPNLVDGLGDGEKGRMSITYTHSEITDKPGIVDVYAYQDGILKTKVYSGEFYNGVEQTLTIDFTMYEYDIPEIEYETLNRSKDVYYYAVATDMLGFSTFDKYKDIGLEHVPLLYPDSDGEYGLYEVNVDGIIYDYNEDGHYKGPVQLGKHYFNEEPPATTPEVFDPNIIGYEKTSIKWPHVVDPDGDEVKYEIYVANSVSTFNTQEKEFYSDNQVDDNDYINSSSNERAIASTLLKYHKVIDVPASVAEECSKGFDVSIKEYIEDSSVNIWIVSKDSYVNSYYRAGDVINIPKGHEGKEIRIAYPRNGSTVYAKQPRILIYLGEDNLEQTTFITWKENTYNNRDNPELFSSSPNLKNVIVFKPPVPYTTLSGGKVTYSVWVHNKCTYGPKTYVTYTYKNFFDEFTEERLLPIKSSHVNAFRQAINITRDAYGIDTVKFSRKIEKNMLFENFDFNETKDAIVAINDKINNADTSDGLDYNNSLIVNVNDLDLVEYQGSIEAGSYEEFIEWARLVYILENL